MVILLIATILTHRCVGLYFKKILYKFLPELQVEHSIQKAENSCNNPVKAVFKDNCKPNKFTHFTRFTKWVQEDIIRTVLQWLSEYEEYECRDYYHNSCAVAIFDQSG